MSNLFGKSGAEKRLAKFKPSDFLTAGLSGTFTPRLNRKGKAIKGAFDFALSRSSGLEDTLGQLTDRYAGRADAFGNLRGRVSGAVGDVTRSRIDAIRRAGTRSVGNLREELSKRRVLGSSFAQREVGAREAEFAALESQEAAEGKLTELGLEAEFINQEFESAIQGVSQLLQQLNFESGLAANIGTAASGQLLASTTAAAEAAAARRAGIADFVGNILGEFLPGFGGSSSGGGAPGYAGGNY